MAFNVSQSKVKTYRQCHQAYHYKYVKKLRRISKSRPLQFGTIVHQLHEAIANDLDPFEVLTEVSETNEDLFEAEREMYGDIITDIEVIMKEYIDYHKDSDLKFLKLNGKKAEHDLEVMIDKDINLKMKVDALVKSKGLRWLLEHKTHKSIPNEDERWRNLQSSVYLKALELIGIKNLDGVVWNYIRSKSPTKPQLLKTGDLSKRKIDTLPTMVLRVIEEHGLKAKNNQVLLERATANRDSYFIRVFTPLNRQVRDSVFRDFVSTAREMKQSHGLKKEKNIGKHCSWCDYEPLCRASLTGGDVKFIKEREYVIEDREEVVETNPE